MLTIVRHGDPLFTPNTCSYPVFVNFLLSKSDWLLTESSWKPRLDILAESLAGVLQTGSSQQICIALVTMCMYCK